MEEVEKFKARKFAGQLWRMGIKSGKVVQEEADACEVFFRLCRNGNSSPSVDAQTGPAWPCLCLNFLPAVAVRNWHWVAKSLIHTPHFLCCASVPGWRWGQSPFPPARKTPTK